MATSATTSGLKSQPKNGRNMAGVLAGLSGWGNVETIVCDLDGVIYVDGAGVPGVGVALSALQAQGLFTD